VIHINLIPPEILQARRDERRWRWVWLGGGILAVVVALFWAATYLQVVSATGDVQSTQQEAASLQAQTSRFDVFQQEESDLAVRQASVSAAGAGRVDWTTVLYDVGLVLPTDIYLTTFTGVDNAQSGATGASVVTMAGEAIYDPDDTPLNGYKSIAKMLVRLTDLPELDSVWLTSATLGTGSSTAQPMYTWAVTADITPASTQTASAGQ
jgi:Tfp pilus assembly protein PilN